MKELMVRLAEGGSSIDDSDVCEPVVVELLEGMSHTDPIIENNFGGSNELLTLCLMQIESRMLTQAAESGDDSTNSESGCSIENNGYRQELKAKLVASTLRRVEVMNEKLLPRFVIQMARFINPF
jgi:hypothetical protein